MGKLLAQKGSPKKGWVRNPRWRWAVLNYAALAGAVFCAIKMASSTSWPMWWLSLMASMAVGLFAAYRFFRGGRRAVTGR